MRNLRSTLLAVAALGIIPAAFTTTAAADPGTVAPQESLPPIAKANPSTPKEVIDRLPDSIKNNPNIRIDPSIKVDTPLLYVDGTPVEGQSEHMTAAAASCARNITIITAPPSCSTKIDGLCGFIGQSKTAKKTYVFVRNNVSGGMGCFKVRGYYDPTVTPGYDPTENWYNGGCNDGGTSSATVPWGEVASVPSVKGQAARFPVAWGGSFA